MSDFSLPRPSVLLELRVRAADHANSRNHYYQFFYLVGFHFVFVLGEIVDHVFTFAL